MRTVSTFNLRNNLASILEEVVETETPLIINRFGKPTAILSPYTSVKTPYLNEYFGFLGKGKTGEELLNIIRRNKKEKRRIKLLKTR